MSRAKCRCGRPLASSALGAALCLLLHTGRGTRRSRASAVQLLVHRPHLFQGARGGGVGLDGVLLAGLRHQLLGILGVGGGAQRQRPAARQEG